MRLAALGLTLLVVGGCADSEPPRFRLNMQGRNPADFSLRGGKTEAQRQYAQQQILARQFVDDALLSLFGTPDQPRAAEQTGLDLEKLQMAAGAVAGDQSGKQRGLYRQHCAICHGISGDGAGPAAALLDPYPRDYRQGIFKFKSTESWARPTTEDLKRVVLDGVPGTAMPSFVLLPEEEIEALVEYVKYLSIRGETEILLQLLLLDNEERLGSGHEELVNEVLVPVATPWREAQQAVVQPPQRPPVENEQKWLAAGAELFQGDLAQCAKCHGPTGLGDGSEQRLFDAWNENKREDKIAWWLLPKQQISPRNLQLNVYRGGNHPHDIYRRIYAGIRGTPMPAMGSGAPGAEPLLSHEQIWQLVDYVRWLSGAEARQTPRPDAR